MNKEPISLYIFRLLCALGLFAFMAMLYWSSVLLEQDMLDVRKELSQIKSTLQDISRKGIAVQNTNTATKSQNTTAQDASKKIARKMDPQYPNLLSEDPFYEATLPKLLGLNFTPTGIRRSDSLGKPENLHPFSNWYDISTWQRLCGVSVAQQKFGIYETLAPDMAIKMEQRPIPGTQASEFWIHLRDNVYWAPLNQEWFSNDIKIAPFFFEQHQVTSHDYKFYLDALMNPHNQMPGAIASRVYLSDIKEIEIVDDLTFIVRWKTEKIKEADGKEVEKIKYIAKGYTGGLTPLPRFVYQYLPDGSKIVEEDSAPDFYRTDSVWAQQFTQHWAKNIIVSCGAFLFNGMNENGISFRRNQDFYFPLAALVDGIDIQFKDSLEGMWQNFMEIKTDTYTLPADKIVDFENFLLSPTYKEQAAQHLAIHRLDYVTRAYLYIAWNQKRPFFQTAKERQALTMAINRDRIIKQNLNGMGIPIHGTFYIYSPSTDPFIKPWPYDPEKAKRFLQEEGWYDSDGDGIIDKEIDGKRVPFKFTLTYFVKNPISKSIAEYVSTALKEIGISCTMRGVDTADLSAVFDDRNYDALMLGWSLATPPENPRQLWYSTGANEKGSSNFVGFVNPEADKIIDALDFEYNPEKRLELYHRFDQIINQEQPYTFIYTPKTAFLYREYVQNVFLPVERQDLIPGANVAEPDAQIFWLKKHE